jgi:hypothetical protein
VSFDADATCGVTRFSWYFDLTEHGGSKCRREGESYGEATGETQIAHCVIVAPRALENLLCQNFPKLKPFAVNCAV